MSTAKEPQVRAHATVRVSLTLQLPQPWNALESIATITKRATAEAEEIVLGVLARGKRHEIIFGVRVDSIEIKTTVEPPR